MSFLDQPRVARAPRQDYDISIRPSANTSDAISRSDRRGGAFERFPEQRRHTYRFFPVALAVLPRTTFAATVDFDALAGLAERAAAALVRRTPG
jgi:hypothetical protein